MATFNWPAEVQWPPPVNILLNYDTTQPSGAATAGPSKVLKSSDVADVHVDTHGGTRVVIVPPPQVLADLDGRVTTIEAEQDVQDGQIAGNASAIANLPPSPPASTALPLINGTAAPGVASAWARGDHVHPTDTTRYAVANPAGYQTLAQVNAAVTRINVVPAAPVCSVTASAAQSVVSGTPLKIKFDTVEYDTATAFDLVNNRFKPPVPGYYDVNFGAGMSASVNTLYCSVYKNGTEYRRSVSGSNAASTRLSVLVHLNGSTDYMEGWLTANAAGTTTTNSITTAFTVALIQASAT
jgi:hypothetical protein